METLGFLLDGFAVALTPLDLALMVLGCFVGTLIGALPGIRSRRPSRPAAQRAEPRRLSQTAETRWAKRFFAPGLPAVGGAGAQLPARTIMPNEFRYFGISPAVIACAATLAIQSWL